MKRLLMDVYLSITWLHHVNLIFSQITSQILLLPCSYSEGIKVLIIDLRGESNSINTKNYFNLI